MIYMYIILHRKSPSPKPGGSSSRSPSHSPHPPDDNLHVDSVEKAKSRGATEDGSVIGIRKETRIGTGIGKGTGMGIGKDGKPGPRNALLQVSEAHLAILPDEDGDT